MLYVVGSDPAVRMGLAEVAADRGLQTRPFQSGPDFLDELPHLEPGLTLIDVGNAGMGDFHLIEAVVRSRHIFPVIAVTAEPDVEGAIGCLKRGAIDVLSRPYDPAALQEAVTGAQRVLEARRSLFEQAERDDAALRRLSPRERKVLSAMALGMTNKAIAELLCISVRTVESYRITLIEKLDVRSAAGAIALAVRHETLLRVQPIYGVAANASQRRAA